MLIVLELDNIHHFSFKRGKDGGLDENCANLVGFFLADISTFDLAP